MDNPLDTPAMIRERNRGCYQSPHSGVGMEFEPLELAAPGHRLVLHECGFLSGLDWWMFPNTVSPFWRLYHNSRPGHHVVFGGKPVALTPDRIVLIPEGNAFDSRGEQAVDHFWMTFSLGFAARNPGPIILPAELRTRREVADLTACFDGIGTGNRFGIYHRALALLHGLIAGIGDHLLPGERSQPLARAVDHMRQHFAEPLHITGIARAAGLSQRSLSDHFQKEYHCSPGQFLAKLRIGEAASMLIGTGIDIDEIARLTGFTDRFYLSRVFKRAMGKSPARYRKEHARLTAAGLTPARP